MDVAFTMMGSAVPLRGSEAATALRPFGFTSRYFNRIKNSIEQKHLALIPGNGASRHAFICVADVAVFLAAAISGPSGIFALGGPEALTYLDVVNLYERILSTKLRVQRTPSLVFRAASFLLGPLTPQGRISCA